MTALATPTLRPVIRIVVNVAPPEVLGQLSGAERRIISIVSGTVSGPGFTGAILPGGSDMQVVRADGTIELTARYAADVGPHGKLLIENTGIRRAAAAGEESTQPYFRGVMRFSAPSGSLEWLNNSIFVSTGYREGGTVYLEVLELL